MGTPRKTRWLQVAKRASEFQLLQGSSEVAQAAQKADAARATLQASQELNRRTQSTWRDHLSQPVFHAGDDAQFRRYQDVLNRAERRDGEAAEQARAELEIARLALRIQLAEKNALQAAIQNMAAHARLEAARSIQKETDETWSVGQQHDRGANP
jgi:hypothetical protein